MAFPPPHLVPLLKEVGSLLRKRKELVAVVDTASGGLISALLLSQPGASSYYGGGITAYTLSSRVKFLGWEQKDIDGYRGPTEAIVLDLAENARSTLGAAWGLAESGVAGPTRPSKYSDDIGGPGHCPIAVVGPSGFQRTKTIETGKPAREENMLAFAEESIKALLEGLQDLESKQNKASL